MQRTCGIGMQTVHKAKQSNEIEHCSLDQRMYVQAKFARFSSNFMQLQTPAICMRGHTRRPRGMFRTGHFSGVEKHVI